MDTRESLERSLEGARKAGAREVAYWSLKWLQGTGKNRQIAREVIKAIPVESPGEVIPSDMNQPSAIQWLLVMNGFDIGKFGPERNGIDGIWGKRSQQALDDFRRAQGNALTGPYTLDDATALINGYRTKTR